MSRRSAVIGPMGRCLVRARVRWRLPTSSPRRWPRGCLRVRSSKAGMAMVREIDVAQRLVKKLAKILRITPDVAGFRSVPATAAMDAIEKVGKPWSVELRDKKKRENVV